MSIFSFLRKKSKAPKASRFFNKTHVQFNLSDDEVKKALAKYAQEKYFPKSEIDPFDVHLSLRFDSANVYKWGNNGFKGEGTHMSATIIVPIL